MELDKQETTTANEERELCNRLLIAIRERMAQEAVQEADLLRMPAGHLGE